MTLLKVKALAALLITVLAISVQETPSQATSHKPTLAQIEAAKKAELAISSAALNLFSDVLFPTPKFSSVDRLSINSCGPEELKIDSRSVRPPPFNLSKFESIFKFGC